MRRRPDAARAFAVGRRFWPQVDEHRGRLVLVALLTLGAIGFELLRPWPMRWLFDAGLVPQGEPRYAPMFVVWTAAAALLAVLLAKAVLEYVGLLSLTAVGHAVSRSLRHRIFAHLVELPPAFHARHKSGDLLMRLMGDVPMLKDMLVDASVNVTARVLQAAGTVAVMFVVDPLLAAVVLGAVPLVALAVGLLAERLRIATRKQRRKEGELADFLHEAIDAAPVLQSLGSAGHTVRRFARTNRRTARAGLRSARAAARLSAVVETLLGAAFAGCVLFGGYRVTTGALSPGELLVFLSYVRGLLKPVRAASKHQARIAKGTACGERILAVLDEGLGPRARAGDAPAPARPEVLAFEDVHYAYPDGSLALRGVNATLRRGELVALFGPSGAGKSTLLALALRADDPTRGALRLDGRPLPEYDLDALRACFGAALQATVLFGESVRENLLLARPEASDGELWAALRAAALDGVVAQLPGSLDAVLGTRGAGLSGGEARRLCLARALLRDAPILLLDEPFAGLDRCAADQVLATLRGRAEDGAALVVTHDVERLEAFDRVLWLEGGRVRDAGSHAALLEHAPAYAAACRGLAEVAP